MSPSRSVITSAILKYLQNRLELELGSVSESKGMLEACGELGAEENAKRKRTPYAIAEMVMKSGECWDTIRKGSSGDWVARNDADSDADSDPDFDDRWR